MASTALNILGGGLVGEVKDVIAQFHESAEDKAKFAAMVDANKAAFAQKQLDLQGKLADAISAEVLAAQKSYQADATSDDKYTKRARPTFMYMCTLMVFWNYAIVPLWRAQPVDFPPMLWQTFGGLLLVAIGGRTWEKINAQNQAGK